MRKQIVSLWLKGNGVLLCLCIVLGFPILCHAIQVHTGVWEELPNTKMSAVYYDWSPNSPPGDSTHISVMNAWCGAALDTTRNRMLFWGGGHSAYAGNEIYAFDFDTNKWSIVAQPDTYANIVEDLKTGPDCTNGRLTGSGKHPKTIHTYDGVDYYEHLDSFCSNFGVMGAVDCSTDPEFMCYSFTTDSWTVSGFAETTAGGATLYGAINPLSKLWYGAGAANSSTYGRFCKYDPVTDTRVYGDDNNSLYVTYNKNFGIDYRRNRGVLYRQKSTNMYYVDLDNFTEGVTDPGNNTYVLSGDSSWFDGDSAKIAGMDYDPVLDKMIFWPGSGSTVYAMDTLTGEMTAIATTGATPTDAANNGTFSRFKYIPKENKFALVNATTENVFLLKLSTLTNIATVSLNSSASGENVPISIEQGFTEGDVPSGARATFRLPDGYVLPTSYECESIWSDGSCKNAIMSAIIPKLEASTDFELDISQSTSLTEGSVDIPDPINATPSPSPAPTATDITTVTLNSSAGGENVPITIGQGFTEGDVPSGADATFRLPDGSVLPTSYECKSTWSDGSCKHAIMSAIIPKLETEMDLKLDISQSTSLTEGRDDLSESDIVTAAPTATVAFSGQSWTTVSLASLLGSPVRTFFAGPDMVEAHYSQDVAEDSDVCVKFYVRYYSTGDTWIRVGIENGVLDGTSGTTKTYTPTVTIGSTQVYNTEVVHYGHTRWTTEGWASTAPASYTIKHDTQYLEETKLVPNYWKNGPSESVLNDLLSDYTPMARLGWTEKMGSAGWQNQIGLLPLWDALYINSLADSRAYDSVIANAKALNSYPIAYRDPSTDAPVVLSSWPTWTINGENGSGATKTTNDSSLEWEIAHHGSGAYLAYLLTGDYYFLETMQYQATTCYLVVWSIRGSGTARDIYSNETRAVGWVVRTIGQCIAIAQNDSINSDLKTWLSNLSSMWATNRIGLNAIGYWHLYYAGNWDGQASSFMWHFLTQSFGYVSDLEPLWSMTDFDAVRDEGYKGIVGILGPGGSGNYCFGYAADPYIYVTTQGKDVGKDPDIFFDSWGDVWTENCTYGNVTCPDPLTSCPNTLSSEGSMASGPGNEEGYWANLLPAIAYAVEDGATGASEAFARLEGATNWMNVINAGFEDTPIWGIYPRKSELSDFSLKPPINLRVISPPEP